MIHLSEISDLKPVYTFQMGLPVPYFFPVDFAAWHRSFLQDTDTALDNLRAQHYYEKNGFARLAVTRSFYRLDK